jgi:hypothetical protein
MLESRSYQNSSVKVMAMGWANYLPMDAQTDLAMP